MIVYETQVDSVNYRIEHYYDTRKCYNLVKDACEKYWNTRRKNDAYENYRFDSQAVHWSLGPMLANNKFDLGFTLLYKDSSLQSVGGVRTHNNSNALILGRHFGFFTVLPVNHALLVPFQINVCRQANIDQAWITVNKYNQRHKTWYGTGPGEHRYKKLNKTELQTLAETTTNSCEMLGAKEVNNVIQDVLSWKVKEFRNMHLQNYLKKG